MPAVELSIYNPLLIGWYATAGVIFVFLFFVKAPYGRHLRSGWGPTLSARLGWLIMELVSPAAFTFFFFFNSQGTSAASLLFLLLWNVHYFNRSIIYPFRMRSGSKPLPLSVVLLAVLFNSVNGFLNGHYLKVFALNYSNAWFADPRFVAGLGLFLLGFGVNYHSDGVLRSLRRSGESGYKIPARGLFKLVSSANYLGEITEWFGWACMTWSVAGLSFAVWTACNLVPRAWAHHQWYKKTFPDYPPNRRAIIPFVF